MEIIGVGPKRYRFPDKSLRWRACHGSGILNSMVRAGFQMTQARYPGRLSSQIHVPCEPEMQERMRAPTNQFSISA